MHPSLYTEMIIYHCFKKKKERGMIIYTFPGKISELLGKHEELNNKSMC